MFGLLKSKNPYEQAARDVYGRVLGHVRDPAFYERYGVPDSFDGRFDLLVLHVFMVMDAVDDADFNQALFDAMFADMDQTLREMGIGDMGVPKRMRKMMKGFNGRVHAYSEGALEDSLRRNVYGTVEGVDDGTVAALAGYARDSIAALKAKTLDEILAAEVLFDVGKISGGAV